MPDGVAPQFAAFSTVGAIALQGVRQAEVQLGDTACVIGLGLVGQLVVAAPGRLRSAGLRPRCRAGAMPAGREDRAQWPVRRPTRRAWLPSRHAVAEASGGFGADRVFLVAGGSSNGPVEMAARIARDRATVVDIGKCKLDLPWNAYYEKELDLRFSRSYGPGRYDERYEVEGIDYPVGYVRWTERRNLACFVDLVAKGDIDLEPLVSGIFPITEAVDVYERLRTNALTGVGFLFEYPPANRWPTARPNRLRLARRGHPEHRATTPDAYVVQAHEPAAVRRLHRRGQLRLVDAAAPSGGTRGRAPGARGNQAIPLLRERPEEVRLRGGRHRRRRRSPATTASTRSSS